MTIEKFDKIPRFLGNLWIGFWLLETIIFLLIEGWHVKATSEAEIICDMIVKILMYFYLLSLFIMFHKMKYEVIKLENQKEDVLEIYKGALDDYQKTLEVCLKAISNYKETLNNYKEIIASFRGNGGSENSNCKNKG